ncbi:MAG: hypothetical protein JRJ85_21705 [Deltaproteobacteria bacterium]|nr:hypothetical protein [Deltaproteobacteria bacterium]
MPIPALLLSPKALLLVELLLSKAIRAIFDKVKDMTPEEIDQEIGNEKDRQADLLAEIDSH